MRIENGKIEGDLIVDTGIDLRGMVTGNVFVTNGSNFILHGQVCGDLIIEDDANVMIFGQVVGDVINNGNKLEVMGVISGSLINNSRKSKIASSASIGKFIEYDKKIQSICTT